MKFRHLPATKVEFIALSSDGGQLSTAISGVIVSCRLANDSSSVFLHNVIDVSPLKQVTSARHKLRAIDKAMMIKANIYTEAVLMSHFLREFEG